MVADRAMLSATTGKSLVNFPTDNSGEPGCFDVWMRMALHGVKAQSAPEMTASLLELIGLGGFNLAAAPGTFGIKHRISPKIGHAFPPRGQIRAPVGFLC
jgi:hypothetical protein